MARVIDVRIGDIWKEADKRFNRYVRVLNLDQLTTYVQLNTVSQHGVSLRRRKTWARLWRFNGKHGGYKFVSRPFLP
jgi:hypothetical protein